MRARVRVRVRVRVASYLAADESEDCAVATSVGTACARSSLS